MTTENQHKYILSEETKRSLRFVFYKKLMLKKDFEDFYHDYVVNILSGKGKHQTHEQFAIDWFREKTSFNRKTRKSPLFLQIEDHHFQDTEDRGLTSFGYINTVKELASEYKGRYRVTLLLYYIHGMSQLEIGFALGVTESRVSHYLTAIKAGKKSSDFVACDWNDVAESERISLKKKMERANGKRPKSS